MAFDKGSLDGYALSDMKVATRLFAKTTDEGGCWRWLGAKARGGYGFIKVSGQNVYAHRAAYALMRSDIPAGLQLDHLCRNPWCVNPWHLEPVTPRVNTLRGVSIQAYNAYKTDCDSGHPLAGPNLRIDPTGRRICRRCKAVTMARIRHRRAAA